MSEDSKPNLKCRMYEARYPVEGSVVMGKVSEIDGNEAVVFLVEFRKKAKLILSAATPPVRVLTPKRMEAFRVLQVNNEAGGIVLDENPLPLTDIWEFETRFNEAKFVHSVIYSVADDMKMNLKEAYKLAGWPSLSELKTLHKDEHFLACENESFKKQLIDRISLMRHTSWRIKDPSRLQDCSLKQLHDICYAIALTRHGEAYFKKKGIISGDTYLSIQDVFNKALDGGLVNSDWTLSELEPLVKTLQDEGYILKDQCPLTYSRVRNASDSDEVADDILACCQDRNCLVSHPREEDSSESDGRSSDSAESTESLDLQVPQMKYLKADQDIDRVGMLETILKALDDGPLTCSVFMFPSYKSVRKDVIFEPTDDEKIAFEENNGDELDLHTMLLTGDGVDRYGKHYLEFQDSLGDIGNGDRGFIRFASEADPVSECVLFKDDYDHGF